MADNPASGFSSDLGGRSVARAESLIDRESFFSGAYRTPHNLRIDGRYEGEIECAGTLFIGESASVNARVTAGSVTVAGQFDGEIACDIKFEILRTGRVSGSVRTGVTVVHEGATYEGELRMVRGTAATAPRPPREPWASPAPHRPEAITRPEPLLPARAPASNDPPATPSAPAAAARSYEGGRRRAVEPVVSPVADEPETPASLIPAASGARGNGNGARANGASNGRSPQPAADHSLTGD